MACIPPYTGDSQQLLLFKIASCLAEGGAVAGVASFNGRVGIVTLTAADVADALGCTPLCESDGDARYVLKSGDSMTGALSIDNGILAANDPALELSQTWNNAAVDFKAFTLNVTNTAAGSGSMLLDVQQDAITRFTIFENGSLVRFISQEQTDTGLGLFLRKRGTAVDSTAAIASGGGLATIFFSGWNGAAYVQAASIRTIAEELFTGLVNGTRMEFSTTPIGSATPVVTLLLSGSGQAQLRDGTAALPSLSFQSDTDTGIYRIGANSFGSSAGGSVILATSTTGINLTDALAYQYNSVNVIRAQTALSNYFFGPSGNLAMTGTFNTAIGSNALTSNTTGESNFAFGGLALSNNTSGANNIALGGLSLFSNTVGSSNIAIGGASLSASTSAVGNVSIGISSLSNVTTGGNNTAIGRDTGLGITTGSSNTILGANVAGLAAALSNNIILADGGGAIRLQIDSSGNTTLAGTVQTAAGTAALPAFSFTGDPNTGLYNIGADSVGLSTGGTLRVTTNTTDLLLATGFRLAMASGANQRAGNAVLVAGTVTVANTSVTANTVVMLTRKTSGGTLGTAITYTVIAATSFTITSDSALDTSTFSYLLIEVP